MSLSLDQVRQACKDIGWDSARLTPSDLPALHVQYLETMCSLWPHTYDRHLILKAQRFDDLKKIDSREAPILKRMQNIQLVICFIRVAWVDVAIKAGPSFQAKERTRCKEDIAHFINTYAWAYEPRNIELGLQTTFPLIMYPKQAEVCQQLEMCWKNRQNAIVVKSRGAGISWLFCAMDINHFLFYPGFSAIYGSEKEEKVDLAGDPNSLFGKLRHVLYHLPKFLKPATFTDVQDKKSPHDNERRLLNPDNNARIIGEVGENIGRSGRCSLVRIDEAQDISQPGKIDAALTSVTNCRTDVGTPNGMNSFGQRAENGQTFRMDIGWETDPRLSPTWAAGTRNLDCAWRKHTEATTKPVIIAQEWDRNFNASVEGAIIPAAYVLAAVDFALEPDDNDRAAGFDVNAGGENKAVYLLRKGPVVSKVEELPFKTSTEATQAAFDHATADRVTVLNYDMDGICLLYTSDAADE